MNELALFAGCGGGILGGKLLGFRTICAVELEPYRCERLAQRQNEGHLPPFPIWCGDIREFDGRPWRGIADAVSGGFPCQDVSAANPNAEGIEGARSGLWKEQLRILRETGEGLPPPIKPLLFMENSAMLTSRGLGVVLRDLAELGYDAQWGVLGADDLNGFHIRKRLFLVGYSDRTRLEGFPWYGATAGGPVEAGHAAETGVRVLADTAGARQEPGSEVGKRSGNGGNECLWANAEFIECRDGKIRAIKPGLCGMGHGVANRVDRISAIGDGQVPVVVAAAFQLLTQKL